MDKLKKYINSLSRLEQDAFAQLCDTSINYLRRAISGKVTFSPALCRKIEEATGKQVTRKDLRPDDWHEIWTELAEAEA